MTRVNGNGLAATAALLLATATCGCGGSTSTTPVQTFVAVGDDGRAMTSDDGATWTLQSSGTMSPLRSIATGRGVFVAVSAAGELLTTPDGVAWTSRFAATPVNSHVIFTGKEFIAVGGTSGGTSATVVRSSDGATWTELESPATYAFLAVAAARSTVVVSAITPSKTTPMDFDNVVLASVPPTTSNRGGWVERDLPRFTDSLRLGDETITVGNWAGQSTLGRTKDGEQWSTDDLPMAAAQSVATDGTRLVVVGASSTVSADDGTTWAEPVALDDDVVLAGVGFGAGLFVAVGNDGVVLTSPDGRAWTRQETGTGEDLRDVAFGPQP